jgi:hypothetical protein
MRKPQVAATVVGCRAIYAVTTGAEWFAWANGKAPFRFLPLYAGLALTTYEARQFAHASIRLAKRYGDLGLTIGDDWIPGLNLDYRHRQARDLGRELVHAAE